MKIFHGQSTTIAGAIVRRGWYWRSGDGGSTPILIGALAALELADGVRVCGALAFDREGLLIQSRDADGGDVPIRLALRRGPVETLGDLVPLESLPAPDAAPARFPTARPDGGRVLAFGARTVAAGELARVAIAGRALRARLSWSGAAAAWELLDADGAAVASVEAALVGLVATEAEAVAS